MHILVIVNTDSGHREQVHRLLKSNPSFARVCGFTPKEKDKPGQYSTLQIPSLRKLELFDQVLHEAGLWERIMVSEVKATPAVRCFCYCKGYCRASSASITRFTSIVLSRTQDF